MNDFRTEAQRRILVFLFSLPMAWHGAVVGHTRTR
jgi:hypothetical protein